MIHKRKPIAEMTEDEKNGFWPTVKEAIPPLLRHLPRRTAYAEPCAGGGNLIELLSFDHKCIWASDINPQWYPTQPIQQFDALYLFRDVQKSRVIFSDMGITHIITNPPFSRHHTSLLCEMIRRFSATLPTWLLLPAGFKYNDYAQEFMPYCEKVVAIGRLKWVEGTRHKSNKDFDWYLFDQNFKGQTQFFYKKGGHYVLGE